MGEGARRGQGRPAEAPELVRDRAREVEVVPHPGIADAGVDQDRVAQGLVEAFLKVQRAAWPP